MHSATLYSFTWYKIGLTAVSLFKWGGGYVQQQAYMLVHVPGTGTRSFDLCHEIKQYSYDTSSTRYKCTECCTECCCFKVGDSPERVCMYG